MLLNFGEIDGGSPVDFVQKALPRIEQADRNAGVPENFTSFIEPGKGHELSEAMWERVSDVFARHLRFG